jgi:apoptotic chromatin condensation inducer in the nucleus
VIQHARATLLQAGGDAPAKEQESAPTVEAAASEPSPAAAQASAEPAADTAQPAAADKEEVDYDDSEPEEAPAPAPAVEKGEEAAPEAAPAAAPPASAAAAPREEPARADPGSAGAQRKMFDAALGALRQSGGGEGKGGRKRGAEADAAPDGARPGKAPRGAEGASPPAAAAGASAEVAPSAEGPTTRALHVEGFVRPFTLNAARGLLAQAGAVLAMWFPNIKNYCYVVYESRAAAEAARAALWRAQWPAGSPKRLHPRFVSLREAEAAIGKGGGNPDFRVERIPEDGPEDEEMGEAEAAAAAQDDPPPVAAAPAPAATAATTPAAARADAKGPGGSGGVKDLRELLSRPRPAAAERQRAPPSAAALRAVAAQADAAPTLDELFRKTAAKPHLYWLPLTDVQVAEKKATTAAVPAGNGVAA